MKKKVLSMLLVGVMMLSLTACSSKTTTNAPTKEPSDTAESEKKDTVEEGYNGKDNLLISEEPKTLTLFYAFGQNGAPTGDMEIWKEAAKITNVSMKNVASESITDTAQSLNTMLASQELADLIHSDWNTLGTLYSQGVFMPLQDLIEEYAPNIKAFLEEYPVAVTKGTGADGNLYAIGGTLGGKAGEQLPSMGLFIRKDWLEKLGKEVPTTFQELKDVLYAFRNEDPNGNGKKDEIPYFYRDLGIWPILQFMGAHNSYYVEKDNTIHLGRAEEEYKEALKEYAQWYADGIIDPEIFTRGAQARQELLGNDLGGFTVDWFSSTGAVNDTVRELVPNIDFAAIAPVKDVEGNIEFQFSREPLHAFAWGISSTCKDPVTVIRFMDFCFSEVGEILFNYGIEGKHYTMVDGKPVPTEETLSNPVGYPNFLRSIGGGEIGKRGAIDGEISTMNKQAKEGFELYLNNANWYEKLYPTMSFTEEEQAVIDEYKTNIDTATKEYMQECIMGVNDVDSTWDDYINDLNNMGLQSILEVYNSAYDRYLAQ